MHVLSVFLVLIGLIALVLSLIPLTTICRHHTGYQTGWRAMFVLVLVFILGYLFYCYHLMFKVPTMIDYILAGIFCGGGLFVVLVSRMSLASLNELKSIALEHEQQALHDILTGLPNRKSLMIALDHTVAASGREDAKFAIMVMDLNGFKEVNDTLGHQAGDQALQIIAPRLSNQLRNSDTLCRMGGDEFAVILPQTRKKEAKQVAKKILATCAEPIVLGENKIILGISIGIALSPAHAQDRDTLIRYADVAMYQAKQQKTGVEIYSKDTDKNSINKLSDVPLIMQALKDKELMIYYQPIFSEDKLEGLEISLCFYKADGSMMNAQSILKSLVNQGASWPLIEYVTEETFSRIQYWQKKFDEELNLNVNTFLTDIDPNKLGDYLVSKAEQYQLPIENITIEVSEALLPLHSITGTMNSLRNKGFKIAVEEFGSAGAGLLSLKDLVLDEVKLDHSFIKESNISKNDEVLIRTIKSYCDDMNMNFAVTNVRHDSILLQLKEMGIYNVQGSALCSYMPTEEMDEWLTRHFNKC